MEVFGFWLFACIVVGVIAKNRNRHGVGWFFLSIVISPVLALILVLCLKEPDPKEVKSSNPHDCD